MSEFGHELGSLKEQLRELEGHLKNLENDLFDLLRLHVDVKLIEQCLLRIHALSTDEIRKAHDLTVQQRRASFKVIRTAPTEQENTRSNCSPRF
jgi:hypothetical protein